MGFWAALPSLLQQTQQPTWLQTLCGSGDFQRLQQFSLSHIDIKMHCK